MGMEKLQFHTKMQFSSYIDTKEKQSTKIEKVCTSWPFVCIFGDTILIFGYWEPVKIGASNLTHACDQIMTSASEVVTDDAPKTRGSLEWSLRAACGAIMLWRRWL